MVRLKGGDPLIFGRATEEIEACRAAGIEVAIVPGISAAQGAAASLGFSLTERMNARRVQYVTGHGADGKLPRDIDWAGDRRSGRDHRALHAAQDPGRIRPRGDGARPRRRHARRRDRLGDAARAAVMSRARSTICRAWLRRCRRARRSSSSSARSPATPRPASPPPPRAPRDDRAIADRRRARAC